jgi:hypothetical protein
MSKGASFRQPFTRPIAEWILAPNLRLVRVLNSGIRSYCELVGLQDWACARIELAVEGVFAYCARTLKAQCRPGEPIHVRLYHESGILRIEISHEGQGGEYDACLDPTPSFELRRTSFEAMGLYIAREMLDGLTHDYRWDITAQANLNRYILTWKFGLPEGAEEPQEESPTCG